MSEGLLKLVRRTSLPCGCQGSRLMVYHFSLCPLVPIPPVLPPPPRHLSPHAVGPTQPPVSSSPLRSSTDMLRGRWTGMRTLYVQPRLKRWYVSLDTWGYITPSCISLLKQKTRKTGAEVNIGLWPLTDVIKSSSCYDSHDMCVHSVPVRWFVFGDSHIKEARSLHL